MSGCERCEAEVWFRVAAELVEENEQLRLWLTSLLFYVSEREELLQLARLEIERKFGRRTA